MHNFIRYILRNETKKITTWLIPMTGVILYISISLFFKYAGSNDGKRSFIEEGNIISFIIIFAFSTIFSGVKSISIFSSPQTTGEEIIFSSKPITRFKKTMSKFISLWILILIISIIYLLSAVFVSGLDDVTTKIIKVNYIFSIFLGNMVIISIISSILVMFAINFKAKTTLMLTFLVSIILPIGSLILTTTMRKTIVKDSIFTKFIKPPSSFINLSKNGGSVKLTHNPENSIYIADAKTNKILNSIKKDPYATAAYFDVWQQFSSLYSMTYKTTSSLKAKKWSVHKSKFTKNNADAIITLDGKSYLMIVNDQSVYDDSLSWKNENYRLIQDNANLDPKKQDKGFTQFKTLMENLINERSYDFNNSSLIKQLIYIHRVSKEFTNNPNKPTINNITAIGAGAPMENFLLAQAFKSVTLSDYLIWDTIDKITSAKKATKLGWGEKKTPGDPDENYTTLNNEISKQLNIVFLNLNKDIYVATSTPYVNKIFLYTFWTLMTITFLGASILATHKKDYK